MGLADVGGSKKAVGGGPLKKSGVLGMTKKGLNPDTAREIVSQRQASSLEQYITGGETSVHGDPQNALEKRRCQTTPPGKLPARRTRAHGGVTPKEGEKGL